METLEQIQETVKKYNDLIVLIKEKIKVAAKADQRLYNTHRGIESITFEQDGNGVDKVWVVCDDSFRGSYDTESFWFPLSYVTLSDDELMVKVAEDLELTRVREALEKLKKLDDQKAAEEQRELEQYNKLRAKYEQKTI